MESMFDSCNEMKNLSLVSFNTRKCINFNNMFANTENMVVKVKSKYCTNMIDNIKDYVDLEFVD